MAPTESLNLIQGPFEPISCLNLTRALATVPRRDRLISKRPMAPERVIQPVVRLESAK